MIAKILKFRPKNKPNRLHAMRWLAVNAIEYPDDLPGNIGADSFFGWRFIRATDGIVYFADCIHEGITENEAMTFRLDA